MQRMPLLAEKSRLGQKVVVRRMRRRRNNLSRGLRWENRKRSRRSSYGRVLYNYFSTYDPTTGRYLESDPIGLDGGLNTYGYVSANPLKYIDPYGLYEGGGISEVLPGYNYESYLDQMSQLDYRPLEPGEQIDVSVFGCIGPHCVSGNTNGARHQFGVPALGGGLSFCSAPQPETSCEDIDAARERGDIYPPNNGNKGLTLGRFGVSVEKWKDGRTCVLIGPHVGLPGPIADGGNAMPGSYP